MSFKHLVFSKKEALPEDALAVIDKASILIAQAKTLDEAKNLKSLLDFAQKQAREKKLEGMEKDIIGYKFMLKDKVGEMLEVMQEKGELVVQGQHPHVLSEVHEKTLKDLDMTRNEASEAKQFHKLPEQQKTEVVEKAKAKIGQPRAKPPIETTAVDHVHEFVYCKCGMKYSLEQNAVKASEL